MKTESEYLTVRNERDKLKVELQVALRLISTYETANRSTQRELADAHAEIEQLRQGLVDAAAQVKR